MSKYSGKTISIVVPEGTSCEELRQLLYYRNISLTAECDLQVENLRKERLIAETALEGFLVEVKVKMTSNALNVKQFTQCLDAPAGLLEPSMDDGYNEAVKAYKSIVKDVANERSKKDLAIKKEAEKAEKLKKEALSMSAEEVLERKFKEIANKASESKNGSTPRAAGGLKQNQPKKKGNGAQGPHKGKGKGQSQDASKGKGKGQNPKGKGKSKSKAGGKNGGKGSSSGGLPFWQQKGKGWSKGAAPKGKGKWQ